MRKEAPASAVRFAPLPDPFRMKRGGELKRAQVAYECWGTLNKERSNAILLFTGLFLVASGLDEIANPRVRQTV